MLLDKIGISSPQFLHEGRLIGVGLQIIASCHGIQIQVAIVGAEFAGKGAHARMGQEVGLGLDPAPPTRRTVVDEAHGGPHIVDGLMGVGPLQAQLVDERFELVGPKISVEQAHQLQRVEDTAHRNGKP